MPTLSKTQLLAYRQCPKRLWLEIHRPELSDQSPRTKSSFATGRDVGVVARNIYDPKGKAVVFAPGLDGYDAVIDRTAEHMQARRPLFEAGFAAEGARTYVDVILPVIRNGRRVWHMIEVKSSGEVKQPHYDDVAVSLFVARRSGVAVHSAAVAHIDTQWVYQGDGDYRGLLKEVDVTHEALRRSKEVKAWIEAAKAITQRLKEPNRAVGGHCNEPYTCAFLAHCRSDLVAATHPVESLPGKKSKALQVLIEAEGITDLRQVADEHLNARQLTVKTHTLAGSVHFDAAAAACTLAPHKLPAFFLDFETISRAVPVWKGTRPYQHIPFQFSLHHLSRTGKLSQATFLDLSGEDPSRRLAEALIKACRERGPVFVYSGFEKSRIGELADRFPRLAPSLRAINARLVDLLPIAKEHYYHPQQRGSWSIKSVLPTIAPDLDYGELSIQDGSMAMDAYVEATHADTTAGRKREIERQLLGYCRLDTLATVRVWQHFAGRSQARP